MTRTGRLALVTNLGLARWALPRHRGTSPMLVGQNRRQASLGQAGRTSGFYDRRHRIRQPREVEGLADEAVGASGACLHNIVSKRVGVSAMMTTSFVRISAFNLHVASRPSTPDRHNLKRSLRVGELTKHPNHAHANLCISRFVSAASRREPRCPPGQSPHVLEGRRASWPPEPQPRLGRCPAQSRDREPYAVLAGVSRSASTG